MFTLGNSTDSGMARPMIRTEKPSYEVSGFLIDSVGCKWKFRNDYRFFRCVELNYLRTLDQRLSLEKTACF